MKEFTTRTITGLLYVGIIIGVILYDSVSFQGLILVITILCLSEFYRLITNNPSKKILYADIAGGTYLAGGLFFLASYSGTLPAAAVVLTFMPYFLYLIYSFIIRLYLKEENPIASWGNSLLGQIYIALPLGMLSFIAYPLIGNTMYHKWLIIAFFSFIWLNDTGAYLVGCTLGRHRLFERISPKKSWEGFFGGLLFCLIAGGCWYRFYPMMLNLYEWLNMGIVISVFATFGDLCESLIKRTLKVKDSGTMLPGHGGMLDRLDSVFIAAPATVVYLILIFAR